MVVSKAVLMALTTADSKDGSKVASTDLRSAAMSVVTKAEPKAEQMAVQSALLTAEMTVD